MSVVFRSAVGRSLVALAGLFVFLAPMPAPAVAANLVAGAPATMASSEPVLLRTTPGFDAAAVVQVVPGTPVQVAGEPTAAADGSVWYPVDVGGQGGYLPAYTLSTAAGDPSVIAPPAATDTTAAPADVSPDPGGATTPVVDATGEDAPVSLVPSGSAIITGTNGEGALCRAGASYDAAVLGVLPEGAPIELTGVPLGEWQPVICAGAAGFVHTGFVGTAASTPPVADPALPTPADPASAAAAEPAATLDVGAEGRGAQGGGGGGSGQAIADFAMQYVGYPYVYAGEGPDAFDCSGFTKYVVANTLGLDITHDMFVQYDMGSPVDRSALRPGDLVFFQNTFRPGMSHNGIYIGNNQFVHAENESTGVKVSDLTSDYYASRWYGAVRFS